MNGQFVRAGTHILAVSAIAYIELFHARVNSGTDVRVWLNNWQGTVYTPLPPTQQNAPQQPLYLDFTGAEATAIREYCAASVPCITGALGEFERPKAMTAGAGGKKE